MFWDVKDNGKDNYIPLSLYFWKNIKIYENVNGK